jgi:hypothetical protein
VRESIPAENSLIFDASPQKLTFQNIFSKSQENFLKSPLDKGTPQREIQTRMGFDSKISFGNLM